MSRYLENPVTSLNKESRPFFLGDNSIWSTDLFLPSAITAFGGPEGQGDSKILCVVDLLRVVFLVRQGPLGKVRCLLMVPPHSFLFLRCCGCRALKRANWCAFVENRAL